MSYDPVIKQEIFDGLVLFVLETVSSVQFLKKLKIYRPEPLIFDYKDPKPTLPYDSANQPQTLSDLITQVIDNAAKPGIYPLSTVLYSKQAGTSKDLGSSVHYVAIRKANPSNPLEADIPEGQLVMANGYASKLLDAAYIDKLKKQLKNATNELKRDRDSSIAKDKVKHITIIYNKWTIEKILDRFIGLSVQQNGGDGICQTAALMFYLDDYKSLITNVGDKESFFENELTGFTFLKNLIEKNQKLKLRWPANSLIGWMTNLPNISVDEVRSYFDNLGLVANEYEEYTLSNIITVILNPDNNELFKSWSIGSPIVCSECRRTGIDTMGHKMTIDGKLMEGVESSTRGRKRTIDDQLMEGVKSSCLII